MCSNFALKSGHVTQQVFSEDCTATGRPRSSNGMQNGSKLFTMILNLKANPDLSLNTIDSGSLNVDRIRDGRM